MLGGTEFQRPKFSNEQDKNSFRQRAKNNNDNSEKAQSTKVQNDLPNIENEPTNLSEKIAKYVDSDIEYIDAAELVDIIRTSKMMANAVFTRADAFTKTFRPKATLKIPELKQIMDTDELTPERYDCILKMVYPKNRPQTPDERYHDEMNRLGDLDIAAADIASNLDNIKNKYMKNFGLSLVWLIIKLAFKYIAQKVLNLLCVILGSLNFTVPIIKKKINLGGGLKSALNSLTKRWFGFYACANTFNLKQEMNSAFAQKAINDPDDSTSNPGDDFISDNTEGKEICDDPENAPADKVEQAKHVIMAAIKKQYNPSNGIQTMDDVMNHRDEFLGTGIYTKDKETNGLTSSADGFTEMTIGERIKAASTSYISGFDRLEHKLTKPPEEDDPKCKNVNDKSKCRKPVKGKIKRHIYDVIMLMNEGVKAADMELSAWTESNISNPLGPYKPWVCCFIRLMYLFLVLRNDDISGEDKKNIIKGMQEGIGFKVDEDVLLGGSIKKQIKVFAALFDAVLSRMSGSASLGIYFENLSMFKNLFSGTSVMAIIKQASLEMLSTLLSTAIDVLDQYIFNIFDQSVEFKIAVENCPPANNLFKMAMCSIKNMETQMFNMMADSWKETLNASAVFEALFNLNIQGKNIKLFTNLTNLIIKYDKKIRGICGLDKMPGNKTKQQAIDDLLQEAYADSPFALDKKYEDMTPEEQAQIDTLTNPVVDPNVKFGPGEKSYIDNEYFRKQRHGPNSFSISTSKIYNAHSAMHTNNESMGTFDELVSAQYKSTGCDSSFDDLVKVTIDDITKAKNDATKNVG